MMMRFTSALNIWNPEAINGACRNPQNLVEDQNSDTDLRPQRRSHLKFLFIETFYTGSHALFADALARYSSHEIEVFTMPGQNFRWRMLGAAVYLAEHLTGLDRYDGLIVTDMFNLADFKALTGPDCPPVLAYFHENQLTYPQPAGDKSVHMLGMINITTALAADRVVFNSRMHQEAFLSAVSSFLGRNRDFTPKNVAARIREKSCVSYPGIDLPCGAGFDPERKKNPPLIIWNHRWGYDKNFKLFFDTLKKLKNKGIAFRLALLGENSGMIPEAFNQARRDFEDDVVQFGYVPSREAYLEWLEQGAVVVSTAIQENFGMSVIEAMRMGCLPLLPGRLSYPEIVPHEFHAACLYKSSSELIDKLGDLLTNIDTHAGHRIRLAIQMASFLWPHLIGEYDRLLEELAAGDVKAFKRDN